MRTTLAVLAAVFLTAHLACLSPTLEDIDSVNFALGVRDFDVARHQPHPPGAPVFIALAKGSTAVFNAIGIPGAPSRAIAFWSALGGALMLPLLALLFEGLDGDRRRAFLAAVVAALAPLAWFTASRPMSDVAGLAIALAAQVLIFRAWRGRAASGSLIAGAFVAGLAAGVRIQTAALTAPVLAIALLMAPAAITVRARLLAAAAALGGVLLWLVPLLVATGGPTNYLAAVGSQAGEDLVGVVMLWTRPEARVAFHAFVNALVWPWGTLTLGTVVVSVACIGAAVSALRSPAHLGLLALLFGPYAVLHLLLQETLTMRYALPLLAPVAHLFVRGAQAFKVSPFAEITIVALALVVTVPQTIGFAKGSPGIAAMSDAFETGAPIGGHAGMRRMHEWLEVERGTRAAFLRAPHGFEWLTLVEEWRRNPAATVQFLANPRRTDYKTLFDPHARLTKPYRWPFPEWPHLGGARPGAVDRVEFAAPGWMLDRGWAVSPEVAGTTEVEGFGPHRRPSIAWVRGRDGAATLMIGGRHLGARDEPDARITLAMPASQIAQRTVKPGFFFDVIELPAGVLSGARYLPLSVTAESVVEGTSVRVALEQFDLQPSGRPMAGAGEGWHEPEYNRSTGRSWRWASQRAALWVRPVGRDVILTIDAESPLRYFDAGPALRVTAAGRELGRLSPTEDFKWEVTLPADVLDQAKGSVVVESDKWFVPAERDGLPDRRRLALRVYSFTVR